MNPPENVYIRRTYEPLKFLGRFFWVPLTTAPHTPAVSYTPTWEAAGEHWGPTLVFRLPLTRWAVGLGVWLDFKREHVPVRVVDAEYDAYVAVNGVVDRERWQTARAEIAALGLDPDEEMEHMQAMGIFE